MTRKSSLGITLLLLILVGLPIGQHLIHLLTESWWFESLGYADVFWKSLLWEGLLGIAIFSSFIAILGFHYWLSQTLTRDRSLRLFEFTELEQYSGFIVRSSSIFLIGFIAFIAATNSADTWTTLLQFIHGQPFNQADPIFAKDIGFYLFKLPVWDWVRQILQMLSIWSLAIAGTIYSLKGVFVPRSLGLTKPIQQHLILIVTAIVAILGWGFWLNRYHLLTQSSGVVYGLGYTDATARLFGLNLMAVLTLIILGILIVSLGRLRQRFLFLSLGLFGIGWLGLLGLYPWFIQQFVVSPNELVKEKPYLANNIQGTQNAYQLTQIQSQDFNVDANLTANNLETHKDTLENVRLWDYQPLLKTYRQLQEIRSYYRFNDVDVDRYKIQDSVQQVMLSARELEITQLPEQAKNWVNQQLKYTHGHGLVMSPVNKVTADGLPNFFIKDIPPQSSVGLKIEQPSIYYGELTHSYILTGTSTDEFDYPQGGTNALTRYDGSGGVSLGNFGRKIAYSLDLRNLQILISNYFTRETKVHYYRAILERAQHIAPFLRYDQDPYLVLADGKIYWVIDAYTVSDRYPYSEPITVNPTPGNRASINYIRNSVKVVVNAYDGSVQFCIVDDVDPIIQTYRQMFPSLFTEKEKISQSIRDHFRYPEDLFRIQANQYLTYHMSDPEVYYNREDMWQIPQQVYEQNTVPVDPYHITMRLPKTQKSEFILMQPFTPHKKDNMIAWMAARSDGENYGSLIQYNFPKQSLVFGPRQIEARIDQDPKISEQLTLWSQSGSKVIRGNLIILPLENALLYVEPIYLRAEQAELPELKRVILAYDKSVVMANTFEDAVEKIFGKKQITNLSETEASQPKSTSNSSLKEQAKAALETHFEAEKAAREGNWAKFGQLQQKLKSILQSLSQNNIVEK
jgi:uncharacterized protein